jgi:hypothetical protein
MRVKIFRNFARDHTKMRAGRRENARKNTKMRAWHGENARLNTIMRAKWEKGYARQERFYFLICAHVHFSHTRPN